MVTPSGGTEKMEICSLSSPPSFRRRRRRSVRTLLHSQIGPPPDSRHKVSISERLGVELSSQQMAVYITSLFCLSFCFHSYSPSVLFICSFPSLPAIFFSLFSVCSFLFTFCHTNHSFSPPSVSVSSIRLRQPPVLG